MPTSTSGIWLFTALWHLVVVLHKLIDADVFISRLWLFFPKSVVADLFPKSVEAVVFPKSIVAQFLSIFSSSEPLLPKVDSFCTYQPLQLACTHIFIPPLLYPTHGIDFMV